MATGSRTSRSVGRSSLSSSGSEVGKSRSAAGRLSTFVTSAMSRRRSSVVDAAWEVGSTYGVIGERLLVWGTVDMTGTPSATLKKLDEIMVLEVFNGPQVAIAYVFPLPKDFSQYVMPGYVQLEDRSNEEPPAVLKRKNVWKSWKVRGRYEINFEATVREGIELDSPEVQDVFHQEEVLLLDIGVSKGTAETKPRLRFKIASDKGFVGWMTAITTKNDIMLRPLNLLDPIMVEVRKIYRDQETSVFARSLFAVGKVKSYESRPSVGGSVGYRNWTPGGEYRVLQATPLREDARMNSSPIADLTPGMSVIVQTLTTNEEDGRPVALVKIAADAPLEGWVQLIAPNGFDNVDTRDLGEFDKVQEWLRDADGNQGSSAGADGVGERGSPKDNPKDSSKVTPPTSRESSESSRSSGTSRSSQNSEATRVGDDVEGIRVVLLPEKPEKPEKSAAATGSRVISAPPKLKPNCNPKPVQDCVLSSVAGSHCMSGCLPAKAVRLG